MALRTGLRAYALAGSVVAAACGSVNLACGWGTTSTPEATPPPSEPVFKPVDPAAPVVLPMPAPGAPAPLAASQGGQSQPTAMVTDLASGWPITLRVGESMTARLTADRAAGLRWSLRPGTDGGIVSAAGAPAYESAEGTSGVEVFRLIAVKPGQTTLTFDYRKGPETVIKSASYPVTVQ